MISSTFLLIFRLIEAKLFLNDREICLIWWIKYKLTSYAHMHIEKENLLCWAEVTLDNIGVTGSKAIAAAR